MKNIHHRTPSNKNRSSTPAPSREGGASLRRDQAGIVSIMVTIIVMIILSLIVLGFARIIRREQRQSLDSQLSTQAFYAAETGINDAVKAIQGGYKDEKTDCEPDGSLFFPSNSNVIDPTADVAYTCLLVDPSPPTLEFDNISTGSSTIIPIETPPGGGNFDSLTFSWHEQGKALPLTAACPTVGIFPPATSWPSGCEAGVLRVDLVPTPPSFDRTTLVNSTMTAYLYPRSSGGGTVDYTTSRGFSGQGVVPAANCSGSPGPRLCSMTITGLSSPSYLIRVKSIYKASALTISAEAGGSPTDIIGTQAIVDSTGKANDVLRRVVARVPTRPLSDDLFPEFAIQSAQTLCKRFTSAPGIAPGFDPAPGC